VNLRPFWPILLLYIHARERIFHDNKVKTVRHFFSSLLIYIYIYYFSSLPWPLSFSPSLSLSYTHSPLSLRHRLACALSTADVTIHPFCFMGPGICNLIFSRLLHGGRFPTIPYIYIFIRNIWV